MKNIFTVVLNMLLFFFIVGVLSPAITVKGFIAGTSVLNSVIIGLIFGIFMMLIPNILKFFKLPINNGSLFLMGIIVSFAFFFLGIYLFNFISVNATSVDLGVPLLTSIRLQDRTVALVFLSIVSTALSIGMEVLNKKK